MRLKLTMTIEDMICEMSDGNPGAINVMCYLIKEFGDKGLLAICLLDEMEIYGANIFICAKDICKSDAVVFKNKIFDKTIKEDLDKYRMVYK